MEKYNAFEVYGGWGKQLSPLIVISHACITISCEVSVKVNVDRATCGRALSCWGMELLVESDMAVLFQYQKCDAHGERIIFLISQGEYLMNEYLNLHLTHLCGDL